MFNHYPSKKSFTCTALSSAIVNELLISGFSPVEYPDEKGVFLLKEMEFSKSMPHRFADLKTEDGDKYHIEIAHCGTLHVLNKHGEFETLKPTNDDYWSLLHTTGVLVHHKSA